MKTIVVNKRYQTYNVYIGRGSKWGNPFIIGKDGDRKEVIKKHKKWLLQWIQHKEEIVINGLSNKWVIEHLEELCGQKIACFCKPLACHGDFLVELIEKLYLNKNKQIEDTENKEEEWLDW